MVALVVMATPSATASGVSVMSSIKSVSRSTFTLWVIGLWLVLAAPTFAATPATPPCSNNAPVLMTTV